MMQTVLACTAVRKTFEQLIVPTALLQDRILHGYRHRARRSIEALHDISLSLFSGEWIGIYGPNGCGKTTLLKVLAGLLPPDGGKVTRRGQVACFFDLGTGFHPEWSAEENVYFYGLLHGIPHRRIRELTEEIIAFSGIGSHRNVPLKCYSAGMHVRLAFAAFAHVEADVYLFDEIFAVGDAAFQAQSRGHFARMRSARKSAVFVSHSEHLLRELCDRVFYMEAGRFIREWRSAKSVVPSSGSCPAARSS